ncbi:hypothetical protein BD289DRAFT_256934 [Coniella lustricola]|uniref:COP9 signalosome complex subunit 6 n=1 Tax=Coniella lustricola TaxID=2025994 RepID=A0A2T3AKT9_9PEZI|nr:hypothetical protein BD289DRAFT_256934 [Coniella lustricola]
MEHVILHPLPLISISDYVVRHTLRKEPGPVVGALLGQQNGREISIEFAYEVKTSMEGQKDVIIDTEWFDERLEQMKLVHKDRGLDLVGWYTLLPRTGPSTNVLPIHNLVLQRNESAILLGLHVDEIGQDSIGGKLPVTLYETSVEVEGGSKDAHNEDEDKEMKDGDAQLKLKFRELPFVVETGEAEMISMSSVAGGSTNAASAQVREKQTETSARSKGKSEGKGKDKGKGKEAATTQLEKITPATVSLSKENEDLIAALTTKANAIKMLKSRIDLIIKFLHKLPPPYAAEVEAEANTGGSASVEPSQTLLRLIQALVHRLSLVQPADAEEFKEELLREENDVSVIMLLNQLMERVPGTREVGKKFSAVEAGKNAQKQQRASGQGGSQHFGSMSPAGVLL